MHWWSDRSVVNLSSSSRLDWSDYIPFRVEDRLNIALNSEEIRRFKHLENTVRCIAEINISVAFCEGRLNRRRMLLGGPFTKELWK